MYFFRIIGLQTRRYLDSVNLLFSFIGHLCISIYHALIMRIRIPWENIIETIYTSGAKLALPLILISGIGGFSLALNMHDLLQPFNLQTRAVPITLTLMTNDVLPFLIGFVLCIQSALNLIDIEAIKLHQVPQIIVLEYIFPILVGMNITAVFLYIYLMIAILSSTYLTFHYLLHYDIYHFLLRLTFYLSLFDIFSSLFKTAVYCTIASLTVGYYYYEVALRDIVVRKAVSRIITRGIFWIVIASAYFKLFDI